MNVPKVFQAFGTFFVLTPNAINGIFNDINYQINQIYLTYGREPHL